MMPLKASMNPGIKWLRIEASYLVSQDNSGNFSTNHRPCLPTTVTGWKPHCTK